MLMFDDTFKERRNPEYKDLTKYYWDHKNYISNMVLDILPRYTVFNDGTKLNQIQESNTKSDQGANVDAQVSGKIPSNRFLSTQFNFGAFWSSKKSASTTTTVLTDLDSSQGDLVYLDIHFDLRFNRLKRTNFPKYRCADSDGRYLVLRRFLRNENYTFYREKAKLFVEGLWAKNLPNLSDEQKIILFFRLDEQPAPKVSADRDSAAAVSAASVSQPKAEQHQSLASIVQEFVQSAADQSVSQSNGVSVDPKIVDAQAEFTGSSGAIESDDECVEGTEIDDDEVQNLISSSVRNFHEGRGFKIPTFFHGNVSHSDFVPGAPFSGQGTALVHVSESGPPKLRPLAECTGIYSVITMAKGSKGCKVTQSRRRCVELLCTFDDENSFKVFKKDLEITLRSINLTYFCGFSFLTSSITVATKDILKEFVENEFDEVPLSLAYSAADNILSVHCEFCGKRFTSEKCSCQENLDYGKPIILIPHLEGSDWWESIRLKLCQCKVNGADVNLQSQYLVSSESLNQVAEHIVSCLKVNVLPTYDRKLFGFVSTPYQLRAQSMKSYKDFKKIFKLTPKPQTIDDFYPLAVQRYASFALNQAETKTKEVYFLGISITVNAGKEFLINDKRYIVTIKFVSKETKTTLWLDRVLNQTACTQMLYPYHEHVLLCIFEIDWSIRTYCIDPKNIVNANSEWEKWFAKVDKEHMSLLQNYSNKTITFPELLNQVKSTKDKDTSNLTSENRFSPLYPKDFWSC